MQRAHFNGSPEIGVYTKLTNTYFIIGSAHTSHFRSMVEEFITAPIIETTINSIRTIGSQIQGNKYGLLVPMTTHDQELILLRQSLPDSVRIRRIEERLNALGNILLCNDYAAIVHPEVDPGSLEIIENVLNVPVHRMCIGDKPLVGTYGSMNNQGLLVSPETSEKEQKALSELLCLQVMAGTVNTGKGVVGGGLVVNDTIGFCGKLTSNPELSVMEKVFMLQKE